MDLGFPSMYVLACAQTEHACLLADSEAISRNLLAKQSQAPAWRADSPLQAPLHRSLLVEGIAPVCPLFHHRPLLPSPSTSHPIRHSSSSSSSSLPALYGAARRSTYSSSAKPYTPLSTKTVGRLSPRVFTTSLKSRTRGASIGASRSHQICK